MSTIKAQIPGLSDALIEALSDRDASVRKTAASSLIEIGRHQLEISLKAGLDFLTKHPRLARGHRILILEVMEKICKEHIAKVPQQLGEDLVALSSRELTMSSDVVPEWQTAASSLLTTLGLRFANKALSELLGKFPPGGNPHYFVVKSLGQLANCNAKAVVPSLSTVIARMLPMLSQAKHENMQWVFSSTIGLFCESILEYLADTERATKTGITAEMFEGEVYSAYEHLYNQWLPSKESRLRLAVVGSIGFCAKLLSVEHLNDQLPKLVPAILNLYRKHSEHYYLSQSMCYILEAAAEKNTPCFYNLMENVLVSLHTYACVPVDPSSAISMKNHSELLRCFTVLTNNYSDRVVSFLLSKLEDPKEKIRLPTLNIIKHIINSCEKALEEDKRPLIVNGLKIILLEPNLKVRSVFAQVIISMASHRYLSEEGGKLMIEFVVKQCAMDVSKDPGKLSGPDPISPKQLRDMNDSVLRMLSTTIPHMDEVLWPYLLEFLKPVEYTEAFAILTRSLAHIAGKKREAKDEDYVLDFEQQVNLPKREEIIARLFVMAAHPSHGRGRGEHVLQCFQAIGPNLAPPMVTEEGEEEEENPVVTLWDNVIPKLLSYLNEQTEKGTWDQKNWEDLLLKLLSKTLDVVNDEEWVVDLGRCFGTHIALYDNYPKEKSFLYKCLGYVMLKSSLKDFVTEHLQLMFSSVKHTSQDEREGCAFGFGFCASSHLDQVMIKLEQVMRDELTKKSKGFFSFVKDKSDSEMERIKSTVMLCYGYVTYHSPPHLITSRIEVNIWRSINPHFSKVKDTLVKQNLIRTMELIGRSLHPDHLKQKQFIFHKRVDLINHLLEYVKEESASSAIITETRALAIDCLAVLVKLPPRLTDAEQFDVIKVALDHTLAVPPTLIPTSEKKGKDPAFQQLMADSKQYTQSALASVCNLAVEILLREISSKNFESIYKHLEPWMQSTSDVERGRSIVIVEKLLQTYKERYESMEETSEFEVIGHLIGRLVPRATDPEVGVRQTALQCVQLALQIGACEKGKSDKLVDAVSVLKERAVSDESSSLFTLVSDLGKVLYKKTAEKYLWDLSLLLMEGLLDNQPYSSNGACVVLNSLLKQRGPSLRERLPELIDALHDRLESITNPQTRTGTLRCMKTLAVLFTIPCVSHLLNKSLPYDRVYVEMWQTLGGDKQLVTNIFSHMLETLSLGLPYQEKAKGNSGETVKTETPIPKSITAALAILLQVEEAKEAILPMYSKFMHCLLARIGNSIDLKPADSKSKESSSISLAIEAFRVFLDSTDSGKITELLDATGSWSLFENLETYPGAVMTVARAFGDNYRSHMIKVVENMSSSLSSVYENQRIMVVSFYAQLICCLGEGDLDLVEQLMNFLLGRQVDSSYVVRMICIQGLGNIAAVKGQVSKFSTTVLSALMAGMDDRLDPTDMITMEAMSGLAKVFERIEESCVRPILINIALRIRPCFEKELPPVRAAAFNLFGSLARFSDGPSRGPFLEQIQTNFVTLLLHLNEEDPSVVNACKFALRRLGPLMGSKKINDLFQKNLDEGSTLLYGEFLNSFCKLMVVDFQDKVNFYVMDTVSFFKSMSPEIRGNAALLVGFSLGHLPKDRVSVISKEHICEAIILLLKDPSENVRCCAAEAISMLHRY